MRRARVDDIRRKLAAGTYAAPRSFEGLPAERLARELGLPSADHLRSLLHPPAATDFSVCRASAISSKFRN